ncbi:MAG: YgaP family membrane protein [Terriglobales bacterium]
MTVERWLRLIAGTFTTASVGLGYWVSPYFLLFTAFVGLNLLQSGLTNWCPMMSILKVLGVPESAAAKRSCC